MQKINKRFEYSLIALKHIHTNPERRISAREVAEAYDIPYEPTARVMQQLAKEEILDSKMGSQGGYSLEKSLDTISIYDILIITTGQTLIANCIDEKCKCRIIKTCNVISPIQHLNEKVNDLFKETLLGDLFTSKHPAERNLKLLDSIK